MKKAPKDMRFAKGKTPLYIWVKKVTKEELQRQARARDMSMTRLAGQVLENAMQSLRVQK